MYTHQEKDGMIKVMWLACFNSIHYKLLHKNYEDLKKKNVNKSFSLFN